MLQIHCEVHITEALSVTCIRQSIARMLVFIGVFTILNPSLHCSSVSAEHRFQLRVQLTKQAKERVQTKTSRRAPTKNEANRTSIWRSATDLGIKFIGVQSRHEAVHHRHNSAVRQQHPLGVTYTMARKNTWKKVSIETVLCRERLAW